MTGVGLELITDPEMYEFCERGKRGGVSMAAQRHAKANNPYLVPALTELKSEPESEPSPKFASQVKKKRTEQHRHRK